jgi:hypothetical protein
VTVYFEQVVKFCFFKVGECIGIRVAIRPSGKVQLCPVISCRCACPDDILLRFADYKYNTGTDTSGHVTSTNVT